MASRISGVDAARFAPHVLALLRIVVAALFLEHGVVFTIATDGPEMMRTHLRDEFELLIRIGALAPGEAEAANRRGHAAAFLAP